MFSKLFSLDKGKCAREAHSPFKCVFFFSIKVANHERLRFILSFLFAFFSFRKESI